MREQGVAALETVGIGPTISDSRSFGRNFDENSETELKSKFNSVEFRTLTS